jgi:uncharacterized protein (DUF1697 family)
MHGWVALLRGINVGGHKKVPMADLRRIYEELGCEDVRTYIASGNVVFASPESDRGALATALEEAVAAELGVSSFVVLRSFAEIRKVARSHPFGADTSQSFVTFLVAKPKAADARRLNELDLAPDELKVLGSEVFLRYPNGLSNARLTGAQLDRAIGVPGTNRNWRTVAKLAEMTAES